MCKRQQSATLESGTPCTVIAAIAAGMTLATAAHGGDCVQPTQGTCPPPATKPIYMLLGADAPRFADDVPGVAPPSRTYDSTPLDTIAPPVDLKPLDTGLSAQTSLGTWRAYNAQTLSRKLEASKTLAPKDLKMPKPAAAPAPPLDLWTKVDVEGQTGNSVQSVRTSAGADYKAGRSVKVGVSAEHVNAPAEAPAIVGPKPKDKFGAYVTVQPVPVLNIETKGQLEDGYTTAAAGAGAPQSGGTEKTSVSVASRVGKKFTLENGNALEPFVRLRNEFILDAAEDGSATGPGGTKQSAGAEVTIAKPDAYSLSVTTDVDNITTRDEAPVNGKVQIKLPLR